MNNYTPGVLGNRVFLTEPTSAGVACRPVLDAGGDRVFVPSGAAGLGSVGLRLWRNFGQAQLNWLSFFIMGAYATAILGGAATLLAA